MITKNEQQIEEIITYQCFLSMSSSTFLIKNKLSPVILLMNKTNYSSYDTDVSIYI